MQDGRKLPNTVKGNVLQMAAGEWGRTKLNSLNDSFCIWVQSSITLFIMSLKRSAGVNRLFLKENL